MDLSQWGIYFHNHHNSSHILVAFLCGVNTSSISPQTRPLLQCKHCQFAHPSPRCGRRSGLARHGGDGLAVADTGSRLTTSVGYRGDKPLRHPTLAADKPTHSACCRSLPLRTAPQSVIKSAEHLRFWLSIYVVAGAHTARYVAIGYRLHKFR